MRANDIAFRTPLVPGACWQRIEAAQSEGSANVVGYALGSVADVVTNGDLFELRHTDEPAIFTGSVAADGSGSVITGRIEVPLRSFYATVVISIGAVGALLLAASAWDLIFGTRHLLTRRPAELGPGHPANFEQHIVVFVVVPVLVATVFAIFGDKARPASAEARQSLVDFLRAMFGESAREGAAKP